MIQGLIIGDSKVDASLEKARTRARGTVDTDPDRGSTSGVTRGDRGSESASNRSEGFLFKQNRMRTNKSRLTRSTTHFVLIPDSTRPVGAVFGCVGGSVGRLLDTVKESALAVLVTSIGQNLRSKQETGEEGEVKEHSECEGRAVYRRSKGRGLRLAPKAQHVLTLLYPGQVPDANVLCAETCILRMRVVLRNGNCPKVQSRVRLFNASMNLDNLVC